MSDPFPRDPSCPSPAGPAAGNPLLAVCEGLLALDLGTVFLPMRPPHVSLSEWREFNRRLAELQTAVDGARAAN